MASSTEQLLATLLKSDRFKDHLFPYLSTPDICALRLTSSTNSSHITKRLFTRIHVTFRANTFTKQSRVNALSRIGHYIEHLTFYLPHNEATFLPPLIHPLTGNEISFLYTPHTSMGSVLTRPKYANTALGEILTQQYPPLFHAATNVPSFINGMKSLSNMRHLTIRCPGQNPGERYRRSIVDYALISLRISLERAPFEKLTKISLSQMHASAFNYLRHLPGFGCVPSASKRWRQIRKLYISVESWDFYGSSPGLDHLKILDDYIRNFSQSLEKLSFTWLGSKGPCPFALPGDPLFAPPRHSKKLFHEVTSPMSPLPTTPSRSPMHFPKLRYLQVRNTIMNAPQLKGLITSHRDTVKEYDFENVVLKNNGNWEEALSPLDRDEAWSRSSLAAASEFSFVTNESEEDLPSPSAAVEAASRDLMDIDLGAFGFSDEERTLVEGLEEEASIARDTTMSFTTRLVKKRVRRRRRRHHHDGSDDRHSKISEQQSPSSPRRSPSSSNRPPPSLSHSPSTLKHSASSSSKRITSWPRVIPYFESIQPLSPTQAPTTAPTLNPDPHPILLAPTVYDPSTRQPDMGISSVQRNKEQEQTHRHLAEDASARMSALRKAKEAVLMKLSQEFSDAKKHASRTAEAVSACRLMAGREFVGCGIEVVEDSRGLESPSFLLPVLIRA